MAMASSYGLAWAKPKARSKGQQLMAIAQDMAQDIEIRGCAWREPVGCGRNAYHYHTNAYRKLERKPIRSTRLSMGRRQCSAHQFNSFAVSCPSKAPRSSSYLFGRAQEMWTPSWLQRGLGLLAFVEPCPATVAAAFASLH